MARLIFVFEAYLLQIIVIMCTVCFEIGRTERKGSDFT